MGPREEHHDLALMLLAGRSLPGLPWSIDEDATLIARERVLWAHLTEDERLAEQVWLQALWGKRGGGDWRRIPVNPEWGTWTQALEKTLKVPDTAFGLPREAYRPWSKGVEQLVLEFPHSAKVISWVWGKGYQTVAVNELDDAITIVIPAHRVVQEADRLLGLIAAIGVEIGPRDSKRSFDKVQMRSSYDPVSGHADIELSGVSLMVDVL